MFFYLETNSKSAKIYLLATMKYTWCAFLSISSPIPCKFLYDLSLPVRSQGHHTMSSRLTIADMRRAKSMRVMNKALKITYLNYTSVGLNNSIKLDKMFINSFVVFFHLHGPFEESFYYEITSGQK